MSARRVLIAALSESAEVATLRTVDRATQLVDAYRTEVLLEAADKLALELAPEQPGAGPGFLLALRLAVRTMRRIADGSVS